MIHSKLSSCGRLPFALCRVGAGCESRVHPHCNIVHNHRFAVVSTCSFSGSRTSLSTSCRGTTGTCEEVFGEVKLAAVSMGTSAKTVNNSNSRRFVMRDRINSSALVLYPGYGCTTGIRGTTYGSSITISSGKGPRITASGTIRRVPAPSMGAVRRLSRFLGAATRDFVGALVCGIRGTNMSLKGGGSFITIYVHNSLSMGRTGLYTLLGTSSIRLTDRTSIIHVASTPIKFTNPMGLAGTPIVTSGSIVAVRSYMANKLGGSIRFVRIRPGHSFAPVVATSIEIMGPNSVYPRYNKAFCSGGKGRLNRVFGLNSGCAGSVGIACLSRGKGSIAPVVKYCKVNISEALTDVVRTRRSRGKVV